MFSSREALTASFYAWELRGRGWLVSDYPVVLEPPFRYCFLLPDHAPPNEVIDDGKRPTFLSSLVSDIKDVLSPKASVPKEREEEPFEEPSPGSALPASDLVSLRISVPADYKVRPEGVAQLLRSLTTSLAPIAFEMIGQGGRVTLQVTCAEVDLGLVASQLEASFPEAVVVPGEDALLEAWDTDGESLVVDFGLAQEFFLPLATLTAGLDPYVTLVPALASAREHETLVFQVLFSGVRSNWGKAIREALDDGQGGCILSDAPELLPLSREKLRSPLFAACLRVGAQAASERRAWDLARSTGAFIRQGTRPGSNELIPLENEGYPDALHAEALLSRSTYRSGMLLSGEELAFLMHLPDASVRHPGLLRSVERSKALPAVAMGREYVLGECLHRGEKSVATLGESERLSHTWIIGASGAGKSTLLLNLMLQDMQRGQGIAVLDPHGDLIDDCLARVPDSRLGDVILFDPGDMEWPVGLNVLSAKTEIERTLLASDIVGVFRRLSSSWGDQMSSVLGQAVLAILESERGGTLLDLRRFLVDDRFRKEFLLSVSDDEIRFFWEKQYPLIGSRSLGPILTRLDTFLRPKVIRHIVGQKEGKLDLGEVLSGRKLFFGKLSQGVIGEENSFLLGSLLVGKLLELALSRQALGKEERSPFFLFADEFQHFLTPSMETLLSGARKYALGVMLAHQTLAQLSGAPRVLSALSGNAHTRIVFRTSEEDARKVAEGFSFFEGEDVLRLKRGEAIVRIGSSENDFKVRTSPPAKVIESEAREKVERLTHASRERYARPVAEVQALLRVQAPVMPVASETATEKEVTPETAPKPQPESAPIESEPIKAASPRTPRPPLDPAPLGRGGEEHKYLQHLVKRLAEERGFRASIEEKASEGRADVVLKKEALVIGCEISVTTDAEHELENLRKCLAAGFGQVIAIVPDKKRRERLSRRIADEKIMARVIAAEEIVPFLEERSAGPKTSESTVRGYQVKVQRQSVSPSDLAGRRAAVAEVIARSIRTAGG